jgi:3-oxoacyl-[acyl-carrier protein] reductase
MRLKDRVAVVTGGASGFGEGMVRRFLAEGAKVVLADIDEAKGRVLARDLGADAAFIKADVTRVEEIRGMLDGALERHDALDILVNNAGTGQRPVLLKETSDVTFAALFDVNVKAVFEACRHAVPIFRRRASGVIINMASGIALTPRPNLVAYAATKGAVVTLTKALAMELAADGIRVNALCPAVGDTPMMSEFMGGTQSAEKRAAFTAGIPMGRLVTAADVGAAAAYLASDDAAMVTGACLPVDGGRCI